MAEGWMAQINLVSDKIDIFWDFDKKDERSHKLIVDSCDIFVTRDHDGPDNKGFSKAK